MVFEQVTACLILFQMTPVTPCIHSHVRWSLVNVCLRVCATIPIYFLFLVCIHVERMYVLLQ